MDESSIPIFEANDTNNFCNEDVHWFGEGVLHS